MRQARFGLILAALTALGLAAWAPGCLFAPDDCVDLLKCPGAGGDSSSSTGETSSSESSTGASTSGTSTGTGNLQCVSSSDCPGETTVCGSPICLNGKCGVFHRQSDGKSTSQVYGDCQDIVCVKGQATLMRNDADFYDDVNECTDDFCVEGASVNKPRDMGSVCGSMGSSKVCDGVGSCVACNEAKDCKNGSSCHAGLCSPDTCVDGVLTVTTMPPETDKDCGGPCAPCGTGLRCALDADCTNNICKVPPGGTQFRCIPPTCGDSVKNGSEPTRDCGGPDCAQKCEAGDHCLVASDCISGVCKGGTCVAPSCTDAVKNGNETGVDCGTGCAQCPPN